MILHQSGTPLAPTVITTTTFENFGHLQYVYHLENSRKIVRTSHKFTNSMTYKPASADSDVIEPTTVLKCGPTEGVLSIHR